MTIPAVIDHFTDRWAFLSNFHPSPLMWDGARYPTAEHAYNAGKTASEWWRHRIRTAPTPLAAKWRGRAAPLRAGWDEHLRYEVMAEVLAAKFTDVKPRAALLSTGAAMLIEGNRHHDQHWGNCRCERPSCRAPGDNHLGRLLMELRETHRGAARA